MPSKRIGLLGLLNRGGKTIVGEPILGSLRKTKLIILADDASDNTKQRMVSKARSYSIPVIGEIDKNTLGSALGFDELSAVAITDSKAAKALLEIWKGE